ncbi:MAG: hypothetical protein ABWX90_03890 [Candidatus Saccharimonadales bacterium]
MDNVHDLDAHREARTEKNMIDVEPNPLLGNPQIKAIANAPVRVTVARLLYELNADRRTLQPDGEKNSAICEIDHSLIDSNCTSMDDYVATVGRMMARITQIQPKWLVWSANDKTGVITVAYIR